MKFKLPENIFKKPGYPGGLSPNSRAFDNKGSLDKRRYDLASLSGSRAATPAGSGTG